MITTWSRGEPSLFMPEEILSEFAATIGRSGRIAERTNGSRNAFADHPLMMTLVSGRTSCLGRLPKDTKP